MQFDCSKGTSEGQINEIVRFITMHTVSNWPNEKNPTDN